MHETPLFMRVLENPVVRNNAAWEGPKSMEKLRFSTIFLGFCAYLGRNGLFLPVFETLEPLELAKYGQIQLASQRSQCSPKRTFRFGAAAAAIGVFSASTMGASSLKCFTSTFAKSFLWAAPTGRMVLRPHCLQRIKSIAG